MNKQEAIQFYTVKYKRARNGNTQYAYYKLIEKLESTTLAHAKETIEQWGKEIQNKERRAIYRKALRELDI